MNQNTQHCFLLDGKTILPINYHHQLLISLKNQSDLFNKNFKTINNNKYDEINKKKSCSCSLQSIDKLSENKFSKFLIKNQNLCKYHHINNETYLITRIIPSIDSFQNINNLLYKSPSAMTIIIKPFISYENPLKDTSLVEKSSLKKRKNSSSSLRVSASLSNQTMNKRRLSTFKDLKRLIPTTINFNETKPTNILHSRTLLDIYRNKKRTIK